MHGWSHVSSRILVLKASGDTPAQYIPIMNSIFSAQKMNIPVDTCMLGQFDSPFLQQAADLTTGCYLGPQEWPHDSLLQVLLTVFAADGETRNVLTRPVQRAVDFRAVCFCHQTLLHMAFVCPICLSLFCTFSPVCSTCGVRSALTHLTP